VSSADGSPAITICAPPARHSATFATMNGITRTARPICVP
jgi:hypothetical protein